MDLIQNATKLFIDELGQPRAALSETAVAGALGGLLGKMDGAIDLGSIISKLDADGLTTLAQTWLGDGGNDGISPRQIMSLFGESQIGVFASQLDLGLEAASAGLAAMLPSLIDGNSRGGHLLASAM